MLSLSSVAGARTASLIVALALFLPILCDAQTVLGVSPTTASVSGGYPITLYGQRFPVDVPTTMVFLVGKYDVVPSATCVIDPFSSTSSAAVCLTAPPLTLELSNNVSTLQPPQSVFVGLATPTSPNPYFFTSDNAVIRTQVSAEVTVRAFPGVIASAPYQLPIVLGNTTPATVYDTQSNNRVRLEKGGSSAALCTLVPSSALSAAQVLRAYASSVYMFQCPVGVEAGYYDLALTLTRGGTAVVLKADQSATLRYTPTLDGQYNVFVPPQVKSITPSTVATGASITFTISGSGFDDGHLAANTISIGGSPCTVISSTPTELVCQGTPGVTAAAVPTPGGAGLLQRVFTATSSGSALSLTELRSAIPSSTGLTTGSAVQSDIALLDMDFPAGFFADVPGIVQPAVVAFEGYVTASITGAYTFYCSGSESVLLQRWTSGAWLDLCSAANSLPGAAAFVGQASAISTAVPLTAGSSVQLRVAMGVKNNATASAKIALGITPTTAPATSGLALLFDPALVTVVAPFTSGVTANFVLTVNGIVNVAVPGVTSCGNVDLANMIATASFGYFVVDQYVVATATDCTWYLRFRGDALAKPILFNATGTATATVTRQSSGQYFYDSLPGWMWSVPHDTTSFTQQGIVDVAVHGIRSVHRVPSGTVDPIAVNASLPAPVYCSALPVELATSGLTLTLATNATSFPVESATLDFISYTGDYASLGNVLTLMNSNTFQLAVPSDLPSSPYMLYLDMGPYGRTTCGYIVQGFQAILVSPTSGTYQGGTVVTVTGSNFPTAMHDVSILVGGSPCAPFYATASTIQCLTTAMLASPTDTPVSSSSSAVTYFVRVTATPTGLPAFLSAYSSYSAFGGALAPRYSFALTGVPQILDVTPRNGSSASHNSITITGTSLTSLVFSLCNSSLESCIPLVCDPTAATATTAVCGTPLIPPATYLVVASGSIGRSNTNVTYDAVMSVASMEPLFLSPFGGSAVTLHGVGFGPTVEVSVGNAPCEVTFVSAIEIQCLTGGAPGVDAPAPVVTVPVVAPFSVRNDNTSAVSVFDKSLIPNANPKFENPAPFINSFTPVSGNTPGMVLTFGAQDFPLDDKDPSGTTIMIGDTPCDPFFMDTSNPYPILIYCKLRYSAQAGAVRVTYSYREFGQIFAKSPVVDAIQGPINGGFGPNSPTVETIFTFTLDVADVTPLFGSTAGGTFVTVTGVGFGNTNMSVTMGSVPCNFGADYVNTSVTVNQIVCVMSAAPSASNNQTEFIYIQSREVTVIYRHKYSFQTTATALLTKASPLTGNAGTVISLSVANLDPSQVLNLLIIALPIPLSYASGTFTAVLPSLPAFRSPIQVQTTTGYSRSASSIVFVSYPTITSITPQQANTAGGTLVTVVGNRFGRAGSLPNSSVPHNMDNLRVLVCGNECPLVSYSLTSIVCQIPPLRNLNTITAANVGNLNRLSATFTGTTFGDTTSVVNVVDDSALGSLAGVVVTRTSAGLTAGVNLGDYQGAHILRFSFFPTPGYESAFAGAVIQASTDGQTFTTVATIALPNAGWNIVRFRQQTLYAQYLNIVPVSSVASVAVQAMSVFGMRGGATGATQCALMVTMQPWGSDVMSTCLQQPLLCTNVDPSIRITYAPLFSPTIQSIQPQTASTRGGDTVNFYGSFQTVSTTDVALVAGGRPCTVVGITSSQVTCVTSSTYVDEAAIPQVTSMTIAGYGEATLSTSPFLYAERWSTPDAWSFASMPVEGSVVIIPEGFALILDVSPPPLAGLIIYGTLLTTSDITADIVLESEFILIQPTGSLLIGDPTTPFSASFTIVLSPSTTAPDPVFGTSFLAVNGGTISLCGLATSSVYGSLSQTANVGDTFVSIAGITTWSVGSTITIPTSTNSMDETEVRVVNATLINGTNTAFFFAEPLAYRHVQGVETNSLGLSTSYTAVVGLVSRGVSVTSRSLAQRGHVIITTSQDGDYPTATFYYCEFGYLGQRGQLRRHPLSIINVQLPSTIQLTGVSVHDSDNRGIFFEACEHIVASSLVVFNTAGHGIATDLLGRTRYLTISNSYVAKSVSGEAMDTSASCFYFTHPSNNISNSYAIGASFAGYAFELRSTNNVGAQCPQDSPFGIFQRNVATATDVGFTVFPSHAARTYPCGATDPSVNPITTTTVSLLTFFNNRRRHIELGDVGSWTVATTSMVDSTDAAMSVSGVLSGYVTLASSHVVAHFSATVSSGSISVANPTLGIRGVLFPFRTGGMLLSGVNFAGFSQTVLGVPHYAMSLCEGCTNPLAPRTGLGLGFVRGLQFTQLGAARFFLFNPPYDSVLLDMDGFFTGTANGTLLTTSPHIYNSSSAQGLTLCSTLSRTQFTTLDPAAPQIMQCPGAFSLHQVLLIGDFGGAPVSVTSIFGTTTYPTVASTFAPHLQQSVVIVPSGSVTLSGSVVNVSALNFTIVPGLNGDWNQTYVVVPRSLVTQANQLALRFDFPSAVYTVQVFSRSLDFTPGLLFPRLNAGDSVVATIPTILSGTPRSNPSNVTAAYVNPNQLLVSMYSLPVYGGAPIIYDMRPQRCSSSSSCLVPLPQQQATSYTWLDIRAWPLSGRVPVDGDVAVIPRGVYVTLTSSTANLRALIVEGTLEFHFRLPTALTANFVIINGGRIIAGTAANPHTAQTYINLVRDASVPPMTVTESITIESGTLLNMGTLSLYGNPYTTPWTTLGALLGALSYSVTTADVLDWPVDTVAAISSSNYDETLMETIQIAQLASDKRGFVGRGPSRYQHDWYTMTINDNTKLTTAAKVAVLNRTIVIRSTGPVSGCQMLLAERQVAAFPANTVLSNVQIQGCGITNGSMWTSTTGAAVVARNIKRSSVVISQSCIHDSIASAIAFFNSSGASLTSNSAINTVGSSLYFDSGSSSNTVTGNLVMNTKFSNEILEDPATPRALCSYDSRKSLNTFQSNVAAGSASEGFCVQLPSCSDSFNQNSGNEAHSCVVGHFTAPNDPSYTCVAISSFHGWHNSYMGLYSAVAADTHVTGSAVHDNHIQLSLGRQGSGTNTVRTTIIGGRAGYFDGLACLMTQCVANRLFGTCLERYQLNGDTNNYLQGEIGLLVIPFLNQGLPTPEYSRAADALPFIRFGESATAPAFSSNVLDNNIYYYWYRGNDFGRCSGSTAVAIDGFASIRLPTTMISNSSWVTFNQDAQIYIPPMVPAWQTDTTMCSGNPCDALNHVIVNDLDGGFFSLTQPASAISNYAPDSRTCVANQIWNAYLCSRGTVGQLTVQDFGPTPMDSYNLEPLSVREDLYENVVDVNYLPPLCSTPQETVTAGQPPRQCSLTDVRAHSFAPVVRLGYMYNLDFFVEAPRRLRLTLDSCGDPLGRAMFNIRYPSEALLSVWVYDSRTSEEGAQASSLNNIIFSDSPPGSYYYDDHTSRLRILMECGVTAEIHTVVHATVAMLLQTSTEFFAYEMADAFISNISDYLVVPRSQVVLEAVFPGSAVAVMTLKGTDVASYDASTAAADVNDNVLALIGFNTTTISNNLGFPVLQTVAAVWANELPATVAPTDVQFGLTEGLIISLAVVCFVIFAVLGFAQYRLYQAIMQYSDVQEEEEDAALDLEEAGAEHPEIHVSLNDPPRPESNPAATQQTPNDVGEVTMIDVEHLA